jgi:hypothetical protein
MNDPRRIGSATHEGALDQTSDLIDPRNRIRDDQYFQFVLIIFILKNISEREVDIYTQEKRVFLAVEAFNNEMQLTGDSGSRKFHRVFTQTRPRISAERRTARIQIPDPLVP